MILLILYGQAGTGQAEVSKACLYVGKLCRLGLNLPHLHIGSIMKIFEIGLKCFRHSFQYSLFLMFQI